MILPSRVPCKAVAAANAHCLKLSFQIFCICGLGLTLSVLATVDHANFTVRWVPVEMITPISMVTTKVAKMTQNTKGSYFCLS